MKNRKCPNHKACWDYGSCETCELGNHILRLHKRIDRLKKQNETLTKQKNDWERLARFYEAHEPNKWISVEDRLPDNDWGTHWKERKYYLVITAPSGLMSVATYGYKEFGWWVDRCSRVLDEKTYRKVTHWQPLPEPPKESEGTE